MEKTLEELAHDYIQLSKEMLGLNPAEPKFMDLSDKFAQCCKDLATSRSGDGRQ